MLITFKLESVFFRLFLSCLASKIEFVLENAVLSTSYRITSMQSHGRRFLLLGTEEDLLAGAHARLARLPEHARRTDAGGPDEADRCQGAVPAPGLRGVLHVPQPFDRP